MKIVNYLAALPQKPTIKKVDTLRDYDLIILDLPARKEWFYTYYSSNDYVIKDAGVWQAVSHIPYSSLKTFHKQ